MVHSRHTAQFRVQSSLFSSASQRGPTPEQVAAILARRQARQPPVPPSPAAPPPQPDEASDEHFASSPKPLPADELGCFFHPVPVHAFPEWSLGRRITVLTLEALALANATAFTLRLAGGIGIHLPLSTRMPLDDFILAEASVLTILAMSYHACLFILSRVLPTFHLTTPPSISYEAAWSPFYQLVRGVGSWCLVVVIGACLIFVIQVMPPLTSAHELRSSLTRGWDADLFNSPVRGIAFVWTPLMCEFVFRWTFFARCVRMVGVVPGYIISSLAASYVLPHVHGYQHSADDSMVHGLIYAFLYRLSRSPAVPLAMHCTAEYCRALVGSAYNPLAPFATQCELASIRHRLDYALPDSYATDAILREQLTSYISSSLGVSPSKVARFLPSSFPWSWLVAKLKTTTPLDEENATRFDAYAETMLRERSNTDEQSMLASFLAPSKFVLSTPIEQMPHVAKFADQLFDELDLGGKGYLSVDEFAFFAHMDRVAHLDFELMCDIVSRRTSQPDQWWMRRVSREERMADADSHSPHVRDMPLLDLPSVVESRLPRRLQPPERSFVLAWKPMPTTTWFKTAEELARIPNMILLSPVRTLREPLQQQLARQYYTVWYTTLYERLFHADQVYRLHPHRDRGTATEPPRVFDLHPSQSSLTFPLNGCTRRRFVDFVLERGMDDILDTATLVLAGRDSHPAARAWRERTADATPMQAHGHKET